MIHEHIWYSEYDWHIVIFSSKYFE
jgi:hypothetical protein